MKYVTALLFVTIATAAFTQTRLFVDPDFAEYGNDHEVLAILPFNTTISLRPKQLKALKEGDLEKMQESESYDIQMSMYSWFLKRKQQGGLWVDIQNIKTTNAILKRNDITLDNISEYTSEEIAELLEVDGVIMGDFETNKPMSDGAGIALGVLFGVYGPTNTAEINMFIYNGVDGRTLVNYHKMVSGSVGSNSDQLINILMRKASRRIPYTKPKK